MPTYDFLDTETGEHFDMVMKWSEREEFLKENPHIKALLSAPSIVSGVTTSTQNRVPSGFKDVLQKVAEKYPTSPLADTYHRRSIKEAKTAEVVRKHVDKITKREASKK